MKVEIADTSWWYGLCKKEIIGFRGNGPCAKCGSTGRIWSVHVNLMFEEKTPLIIMDLF